MTGQLVRDNVGHVRGTQSDRQTNPVRVVLSVCPVGSFGPITAALSVSNRPAQKHSFSRKNITVSAEVENHQAVMRAYPHVGFLSITATAEGRKPHAQKFRREYSKVFSPITATGQPGNHSVQKLTHCQQMNSIRRTT